MAAPTVEKTYTHSVNNQVAFALAVTTRATLFLALKNLIKNMPGVTVVGSCDGVSAGTMGGTDVLATIANLNYGGTSANTAMSWIVFSNAAWGTGMQLRLGFGSNVSPGGCGFDMAFSPTGAYVLNVSDSKFLPTAGDSKIVNSAYGNCGFLTTYGTIPTVDVKYSTAYSSDGQNCRMLVAAGGSFVSWTELSILDGKASTFGTSQFMALNAGSASANLTVSSTTTRARFNVTTGAPTQTKITGLVDIPTYTPSTDNANQYLVGECFVWQTAGSGMGLMGRIKDVYVVPTVLNDGDTVPTGATRDWIVFGDFMTKWDGSTVPVLS